MNPPVRCYVGPVGRLAQLLAEAGAHGGESVPPGRVEPCDLCGRVSMWMGWPDLWLCARCDAERRAFRLRLFAMGGTAP